MKTIASLRGTLLEGARRDHDIALQAVCEALDDSGCNPGATGMSRRITPVR